MSEAAAPRGMPGAGAARLLSDGRLTRRAIEGDQRAFSAIYRRYHQSLYRFCLAIVGDSQDAQDALQNTMLKVLRALPGERRQIELKPWLYRIAHNESIELLRRRRRTEQLDPEIVSHGSGPSEEAELRERLGRLISDLDELPERQRGALIMRELAGLGFAEIAAALGTSPAVARQTVYEARLSLRQMDEGRELNCAAVTRALSDADGRVTRRRDIRAHLRACAGCRRFRDELDGRRRDLAALSPLPAAAGASLLHGLLGGHGGSGGSGLATALGGGAAKSLGTTAAIKSAAAVAVVAAVGVTAADRGGLIHVGPSSGGDAGKTRIRRPADLPHPLVPPAGLAGSSGAGPEVRPAIAKAVGGRDLGGAGATKAGTGVDAATGAANPEAPAAPTSHGSSGAHAHGQGHEKDLPEASAHGQQTAAGHKAASHGGGHSKGGPAKGQPAHPAKPAHPVHPAGTGKAHSPSAKPHSEPISPTQPQSGPNPQATGQQKASAPLEPGAQP